MLKETLSSLSVTVELDGRTLRPSLKPGDLVRFEQHFGRGLVADGADQTFGFTELMFLTWTALARTGDYTGDFDSFCDAVDDVDLGDTAAPKAG